MFTIGDNVWLLNVCSLVNIVPNVQVLYLNILCQYSASTHEFHSFYDIMKENTTPHSTSIKELSFAIAED